MVCTEASGLGFPSADRFMGVRLGPQAVQCVRSGLAQSGKLRACMCAVLVVHSRVRVLLLALGVRNLLVY